jgi:hypothetical protein
LRAIDAATVPNTNDFEDIDANGIALRNDFWRAIRPDWFNNFEDTVVKELKKSKKHDSRATS